MIKHCNLWPAAQAARAIEAGEISCEKLVAACLDRIAERDRDVRAWAALDRERALVQARALDRSPRRGVLHGVPFGIKDVIDTAELPTEYNSPIYTGFRPKADAACVALLKRAGAVILGKTVTTEFANIRPAQTRNPLNLAHTPGGSSSGSAAAVADLMVPVALGSQTAGSIIRPAAYCGTFAIKPSFGSINRAGLKPLAESLDTIGIFARSAEDLSLVLPVLAGWTPVVSVPDAPRIGFCRTPHWDQAEDATHASMEAAVSRLARAGARVRDFKMPIGAGQLADRHHLITGFESARALAWEYDNFPNSLSAELKARLDAGWNVQRSDYQEMQAAAAIFRQKLASEMHDVDFLITPSAGGEAPASLERTGDSLFNRGWTLLGNPCINVPYGAGSLGLPLGLQLIGSIHSDMQLIAWAGWLTEALNEPG